MDRFLARLIAAQDRWVKPFAEFNHRWVHALFRPMPAVRDFLNGRWIGHPLHALLTDVPIGILFLVILFDLAGQSLAAATKAILLVGILAMLAAAVAGLADYSDTDGTARERATLHGTLMVVALVLYVVSFVLRLGPGTRRGRRPSSSPSSGSACSPRARTSAATSSTCSATWSAGMRSAAAARSGSRSSPPRPNPTGTSPRAGS